jgi:DNA-binding NarL/FixJ family response regulator
MAGMEGLSMREKQVVELVFSGAGNKKIAQALGLAEGTVKEYLSRLYHKLGISNRTELAVWAFHSRETS